MINCDPRSPCLIGPIVNRLNPIREEAIREHAAEDQQEKDSEKKQNNNQADLT